MEYWGPSVARCDGVPLSIAGFTPPAVNTFGKGSGKYQRYSTYAGSSKATGNLCSNGDESAGAFISAKSYDYGFATGAMMYLGGTTKQHLLDASKHPTPKDMPNS